MCFVRLVQHLKQGGFHGQIMPHVGDSAVGRARNSITRKFLESDCTHLLQIDSDLIFSINHVHRIMMHDEPIVGGYYCKKQEGAPQLVKNGCLGHSEVKENGLQQERYIGTGFLRVAREVFEAMIDKLGDDLMYHPDHDPTLTEYDFWKMGVYKYADGTRRWLSEDWYFAQMALDLGYKVWGDRAILLGHADGGTIYPLSYQEETLYGAKAKRETPTDVMDQIMEAAT